MTNKIYPDAAAALDGLLHDGMMIMAGGFGLCGIPEKLIGAIRESGVRELTVVSNNAGIDGAGLGLLLESRQIRKMISSYVGENKLFADLSIVHAWKGDREGNLVYRKTARNFNPVMATAGKVTVAEVEQLVEPGEIEPDEIHTPGIFVQRIVHYPTYEKRIEQRTVRKRGAGERRRPVPWSRDDMARRA